MKTLFCLIFLLNCVSHAVYASSYSQKSSESKHPIRGIYVRASNTQGAPFYKLLNLVQKTDLNAMVIDIKDDFGNLTFIPPKNSAYYSIGKSYIKNPAKLMKTLETNNVFPIARIVVFKDNVLSAQRPDLTFKKSNGIWKNGHGDSFTNPFLQEVWDYNIGIAIEAINLGFKEIQFDYVRFPEKFETFEKNLTYNKGNFESNPRQERTLAVTEFVKYAYKKLKHYNVKMSVDVFGNATVIPEAPGIGQNFSKISEHVDVISVMIYPSHWTSIFGIKKPDLHPYKLVKEYAKVENARLKNLSHRPISRPWIQDFTATWLGKGNFRVYTGQEVEDQIRALHSEGINEFLIWNAGNNYTQNVDYTPDYSNIMKLFELFNFSWVANGQY